MMMFKTYDYMTMYQGLSFVQDLKLGHYSEFVEAYLEMPANIRK
jgi:hypothetical protein